LKPPVTLFQWPMVCSVRIAKASVTMARYRPDTRIAGRPITRPMPPVSAAASTSDGPKGTPLLSIQVSA
jgi:hypothetical protein